MNQEEYLKKLYANRFSYKERKSKLQLWKILIDGFLQEHVGQNSIVLDIGGGYCEFINQIQAKEKYLIDLNPDSENFADPSVNILNIDILSPPDQALSCNYFDRIFISNFFEHLSSKEDLVEVLLFCFKHLKVGGSILVIQPNFKYSYKEYYDFIDHQLPITHISLQEIMQTIGFSINVVIPRFLPFSTKGRPASPDLLKLYLKIPLLWYFLGGQMFIKASKPIKDLGRI
ncbi:MAG: class I SAM-dependent methyltransferase [Symploca sp. SIO1C4]|uniref:Class I SAM-dependent methyltransferase n=1 Tax=Symploca sp. SIO1C4 TaxID=2607765 RepID=A0A6B3NAV6_9CYAN|nr:class I SAM-dependent methyltransferase [Symploca sp. SIO1C4]